MFNLMLLHLINVNWWYQDPFNYNSQHFTSYLAREFSSSDIFT